MHCLMNHIKLTPCTLHVPVSKKIPDFVRPSVFVIFHISVKHQLSDREIVTP